MTPAAQPETASFSPAAPAAVSVIIPTRDRPADLARTVASLLAQTVTPAELIILDQSRGGESAARIPAMLAQAGVSLPLQYLRCPEIPGLAAARNHAMDFARSPIWLFLDDDVVLEPAFLAALLAAHQDHPKAVGISGVVTNYARPGIAFRAWRASFARGPFHDQRQAVYWNAARLRGAAPRRVRRLGGGLMSFRAVALDGLRFDEHLAGVCDGEDVDFCARLGPRAILLMAPAARLAHFRSPVGREPIHWLRRQARSECYLYYRNWHAPGWRGLGPRACFFWLLTGYGLAAGAASLRHRSGAPWRAWRAGLADARAIVRPPAAPSHPETPWAI